MKKAVILMVLLFLLVVPLVAAEGDSCSSFFGPAEASVGEAD